MIKLFHSVNYEITALFFISGNKTTMFNKQLNAKKMELIRKIKDNLVVKKIDSFAPNQKHTLQVANATFLLFKIIMVIG